MLILNYFTWRKAGTIHLVDGPSFAAFVVYKLFDCCVDRIRVSVSAVKSLKCINKTWALFLVDQLEFIKSASRLFQSYFLGAVY